MASQLSYYDTKIWDTTSGDLIFTFDSHRLLQSIVFSPDLAFVFIAGWYDTSHTEAQVWNINTRSLVQVMRFDFELAHRHIALSPCGGRLVSQSFSDITLLDLGSGKPLAHLISDLHFSLDSRIAFAVDGNSVFVHSGDDIIQRWRISPAPSSSGYHDSDDSFSNGNQFTSSLPLIFIPTQEESSQPAPRQYCRIDSNMMWILDEDRRRILWVPQNRRSSAISKSLGKKIAVGSYGDGRVYLADFSDALLLP
jgi:WD40 repeat protein